MGSGEEPAGGAARVGLFGEEILDVFPGEGFGESAGGIFHGGLNDGLFAALHGEDFFLYGSLGNEFDAVDGAFLSDAVGAIGGLVFDGGVPPGVVVYNHVCAGEIQAGATSFETDQK